MYKDRPLTLDALKVAITREVNLLTPQTLRKTMSNFRARLQKVVRKRGTRGTPALKICHFFTEKAKGRFHRKVRERD